MSVAAVSGYLLTLAVHSTVVLGALTLMRGLPIMKDPHLREIVWKVGVVVVLLSATLASWGVIGSTWPEDGPGGALIERRMVRSTSQGEALRSEESIRLGGPAIGESCLRAIRQETMPHEARAARIRADCASGVPSLPWILVGLWLSGLVLAGAHSHRARARLHDALGPRQPLEFGRGRDRLDRLVERVGPPDVHLVTVAGLRSPAVLGASMIGLPTEAEAVLTDGELDAVLAHELAHIRRHDRFWFGALRLITRLFWFQPLFHLALRELRDAAELICDDFAVSCTRPLVVARSLERVGGWLVEGSGAVVPELAVARSAGRGLAHRVTRVLEGGQPSGRRGRWLVGLLVLGVVGSAVALPQIRVPSPLVIAIDVRTVQSGAISR